MQGYLSGLGDVYGMSARYRHPIHLAEELNG
jgi:hypothetical protein